MIASWASETTSLTPLRPRLVSCVEIRPDRLCLGRADFHAQDRAPSVGVEADGDDHGDRDDAATAAHLQIGGVDPQIRPSLETWLLEMPLMPIALTKSSTERVENALDVGS